MRTAILCCLLFAAWLVAAATARAADVDGFHPPGGAPGDRLYVQGARLGTDPEVSIGGRAAEVLRVTDGALLCRIPLALPEGDVVLRVNGKATSDPVRVLSPDSPVVHRLGVARGTVGQPVHLFGRRLERARAHFLDRSGRTVAEAPLVGGARAAVVRVPPSLVPGGYELVLRIPGARSATARPHPFEVVVMREARLHALRPRDGACGRRIAPGERVRLVGVGLRPAGRCRVHWRQTDGAYLLVEGHCNGWDEVVSVVPSALRPGRPCRVEIELPDGRTTNALPWKAAAAPIVGMPTLDRDAGPPGTCVAVLGADLRARVASVRAGLSSGGGTVEADVLYRHPGGLGHGAGWIVRIPEDAPQGTTRLTLEAPGRHTVPVRFRVTDLPFAVQGVWPHRQAPDPDAAYRIEGSGFGSGPDDGQLRVLWTSGAHSHEVPVVHRTEHALRVRAPDLEGLPATPDAWRVSVVRRRGAVTMTSRAVPIPPGSE